ncbi:HRDC domain-containing protein, partial [Spirosoma sp. 48-14]
SAMVRTGERVPMNLLIDILRGSRSQQVLQGGYDQIKTYGAGRDIRFEDWRNYLHQLINIGVIEIAYDQHYALRRGILADQVLYSGRKIDLVRPDDAPKPVAEKPRTKTESQRDELFERLRVLRKQLADEQNVPAYVIFTDTTLEDMARQKPTTPDALRNVSGVGERKLQLFGKQFLDEIVGYVRGRAQAGEKPKGSTQLLTLDLYNRGLSIEEIAVERQLTSGSVASHLVQLSRSGYDIDLASLIDPYERREIEKAIGVVGIEEGRLKAVYEYLGGKYDYGKLTLVAGLQ